MPKRFKKRSESYIREGTATLGYKGKQLGAWPNDFKHEAVKSPQVKDEQSALGKMPVSGSDRVAEVDDITREMGIYDENHTTQENLEEVNIAKQIEKKREG